jgi:hemerythrin
MEWTSQLATGDDSVDAQHRALLGCLGDLRRAMKENRTLFAVYTLTRLKHHVRDHFAAEEVLLRTAESSSLQEHMQIHEQFRTQLTDFQVKSIHGDVSMQTVDYLITWLEQHITGVANMFIAAAADKNTVRR